jgi:hypothetical protein
MYLLEMIYWESKITCFDEESKENIRISAAEGNSQILVALNTAPHDEQAIFAVNERFMDVQAAWQEDRRGVVAFLFIGLMYFLQYQIFFNLVLPGIRSISSGIGPMGYPLTTEGYIFAPLSILVWLAANIVLFRFGWRWIRLEIFTQRRLVIRFNRLTRQVHINRPSYAGGIVTFPWESTVADISGGDKGSRLGDGVLALVWPARYSGAGFDDFSLVGGTLSDRDRAEALWEYIRRYMEEGINAVPSPTRLRSMFPWPWDSVRSTLSFMKPSWHNGDKGMVLTFALLLSPLLLMHSICHWLSLLLCWPTWWPRTIRRAGLPGASVPKLTTADDYGPEMAAKLRASAVKVVDKSESSFGRPT